MSVQERGSGDRSQEERKEGKLVGIHGREKNIFSFKNLKKREGGVRIIRIHYTAVRKNCQRTYLININKQTNKKERNRRKYTTGKSNGFFFFSQLKIPLPKWKITATARRCLIPGSEMLKAILLGNRVSPF